MNELVKQTKNSERTNTLGRKNGVFYLFHLTEICEYYNTDVSIARTTLFPFFNCYLVQINKIIIRKIDEN